MDLSSRDFVDTVLRESDIYRLRGILRNVESAVKLQVGTDPMALLTNNACNKTNYDGEK